jgi:diadenosine tetraphosphate (Ap4A) HIT family hydrolase
VHACAFCTSRIAALALWESEHYRVFADEYPRCVGHVLLTTKPHYVGHMDAPAAWLDELLVAQDHVRRFLEETFGNASFWEHGGPDKEVPHAHLHAVPVGLVLPSEYLGQRALRIEGWRDVRRHHQQAGSYVCAAGREGAYLVLDEVAVLQEVRRQFVSQLKTTLTPTGGLQRLGPDVVERTKALWRSWAS